MHLNSNGTVAVFRPSRAVALQLTRLRPSPRMIPFAPRRILSYQKSPTTPPRHNHGGT